MSLASCAIRAAIEGGSPAVLRDIRIEQLQEDEIPIYSYVCRHVDHYGQLPTMETLRQDGFSIGRIREPAQYYVDQIRKRSSYQAINALHPRLTEAMKAFNPDGAIPVLREMLAGATTNLQPKRASTLNAQVQLVLEDYIYAKAHPGLRGVTLAWPTLNNATLGAQPGDLIVIAGRPSIGKSYALLECAWDAWNHGHSSAFISMEMTLLQLARRFVGRQSKINPRLIQQGQLSGWGENSFRHTVTSILNNQTPMHFLAGDMDKDVAGIADLCREFLPDIIYIDAAYLLEPSIRQKSGASQWEQLKRVIKELKQLAIALDRAIVITVQFNRNVRSDSSKELDMRDIGGTDSIPQDANVVVGLRQGIAPFQHVQRYVQMMKNREGEIKNFGINFRFSPMDFSEVPLVKAPVEGEQSAPVNSAWMV